MKFFFILSIAALTSLAIAQAPKTTATTKTTTSAASTADWKVISETQDCPKKVQIKAKEGEKYVIAVDGKNEYKLVSSNGKGFGPNSMHAVEYTADKSQKMQAKDAVDYSFIQPSYVENRPAKLLFSQNGMSDRCPLITK